MNEKKRLKYWMFKNDIKNRCVAIGTLVNDIDGQSPSMMLKMLQEIKRHHSLMGKWITMFKKFLKNRGR